MATAITNDYREGFTQVWTAPILPPNTSVIGTTNENPEAKTLIQETWHVANNYMYGTNDISFIPDPYLSSPSTNGTTPTSTVMRVKYEEGSYSPKGSASAGRTGGVDFYSRPFGNHSYARALVQYDMAFDASFDYHAGGKLPGLHGGIPGIGCSGGLQANGQNCFSVRLMWRENGLGEAYLYIPTDDILCKETLSAVCNKEYGVSLFRGRIKFSKEQWTRIEIYMRINDPPSERNGILQIWQDNEVVISLTGLKYRTSNAIAISSFMFSTFFGGSSSEYASPHDTYAYFRNIQVSVAEPVHLSPPIPTTSSSVTVATSINSPIFHISLSFLVLFVIKA